MKIKVTFNDTGEVEEHEFNFEPKAGQSVTLMRNGESTDYTIETVSGPIYNDKCYVAMARVKNI